jgi:hypothetical protein
MSTYPTFENADGRWSSNGLQSLDDTLILDSIGCKVSLRDVYDKVDFVHESESPDGAE